MFHFHTGIALLIGCGLLTACDRRAPSAAEGANTAPQGVAPVAPVQPRGFSALLEDHGSAKSEPTEPELTIPQPTDPGRLLFLGMEAPLSKIWQWQPPRGVGMLAQWLVPGPQGSEPAQLTIWAPGRSRDTIVTNTVPIWAKQFRTGVLPAPTTVEQRRIGDMEVSIVDLAGEFSGMGGGWHRPDYRQLAAIVDGPKTTTILRLLGPNATVEANHNAFVRMIDGLRQTP